MIPITKKVNNRFEIGLYHIIVPKTTLVERLATDIRLDLENFIFNRTLYPVKNKIHSNIMRCYK